MARRRWDDGGRATGPREARTYRSNKASRRTAVNVFWPAAFDDSMFHPGDPVHRAARLVATSPWNGDYRHVDRTGEHRYPARYCRGENDAALRASRSVSYRAADSAEIASALRPPKVRKRRARKVVAS